MDKKKYQKTVENAIIWMAGEYKYMKDVKKDLEDLKRDIAQAKKKESLKDIHKSLRALRWAGRAERREHRYEQEVEKALKELSSRVSTTGTMSEIRKLEEEIHLEAESVFKQTSLYEGGIRAKLKKLDEYTKANDIANLKKLLDTVGKQVDQTILWMNALQINLQKAKELAK